MPWSRWFSSCTPSASLAGVRSADNATPDAIVVDFRDADTGQIVKSQTVSVERTTGGLAYFEFNSPKEFTDASSKHINTTIRSH